MTNPQPTIEGGVSEVEIISQQVEEETKSIAPVQLVNFAYRDLPLAALDLSVAGSQLLSNLDEEYQREGSNWLKPCCGRRAAVWQVFLLSASLNSFLVACVVLVVILLTLELLIDIKLLQFSSASQFAGIIHWISLVILSVFFSETILRIVVLGIWDYIENKIEFEIRQLRAHLAQQDLDLAAEREAALQVPHVLNKQSSNRYKVVATEDSDDDATENITELRPPREDDMNNYISRYYNEPSSDSGVREAAICVVTTTAIDVHRPNMSSDLFTVEVPIRLGSTGTSASITSGSASRSTVSSGTQACSESSQTLGSSPDCSTACEDSGGVPQGDITPGQEQVSHGMVQELLSSLSEEACLAQKAVEPVNLKLASSVVSAGTSPNPGQQLSAYQESLDVLHLKTLLPLLDCSQGVQMLDENIGGSDGKSS
ncbi:transmembrane protein 266 isoform X2 [Grus americana]|uniref:transmembrane protein 266 isoform X2 n=1 Tax=Grus americana TaxID=9117 RepID=UPI002407BD8D|nr:transmembrane protein 266 isoform X2 [Grus americana]